MPNIVELKNINKIYGIKTPNPTQVLYDVSLNIEESTFNSIIGQSGSGKSTLLNILGTLDKATSGDVLINGKNTQEMTKNELSTLRNEAIGFIFQFHYLLPEFTALENVLMPYRISKKPITEEVLKRAHELLDIVGLNNRKDNLATNLSGGQQQRVAIARSLINNPKIILADEPTGNLDSDTTEQVYDLLREINQRFKTTFIIITHDRHIAEKADRIIEIKDGRINLDIKK
ncbi:MAG: lipoprotein ABC transporter ATP-binding protein [Tenericutes bacterium GWC2_34_14]|nr:MAG: lipoprotein ABC transporter ATP-binding protein [Tenericutes bacterium GWA2_35_7]OHE28494.1 MAG: lipoprotein ABC transporter ATP-binding protein [Tenericutes bacterium GWC2_34_14]OHE33598.1 MAG: lipoprotein ABC transporter ATP-binding protein [Tenericutes bacterium GWE2_34_108]OHE36883.1 MAG: lipoprotein ABC transporter ATP-binding protein [Tenericutes bacterium GWF1_35_14]OHE38037.1 MAG: lipoprotein ABC transporter ATP-binding protein [Tenericutes bacterium GWF2_35_184]OHE43446.1 MAG: